MPQMIRQHLLNWWLWLVVVVKVSPSSIWLTPF